ncbi:glycine cleavage system protein H [Propionibacteriaceae bacterium G1746]|uniref:glycine cleavage system protein H n=1 Tax=Aestuariimicrobium sp. G57 TaxID=3418485 RepID=UPI003C133F68
MSRFPDDVSYSLQHLWVRGSDGSDLRVGATDYWVEALAQVVHVSLPTVGVALQAGDECGELVAPVASEPIIAPVNGVVTAVNTALESQPELVRRDPYGEGWLFEVELGGDQLHVEAPLMDSDGYESHVGE